MAMASVPKLFGGRVGAEKKDRKAKTVLTCNYIPSGNLITLLT